MKRRFSGKSLYILFILFVVGIVLIINIQANRHFFRVDLTENRQYTIAPGTREILKSLNDYVTVEIYFSENLPPQFQKIKDDVKDVVTEFSVYGGKHLKVEWQTPRENSVAKQNAVSLGLEQIHLPVVEKDRETIVKMIAGVAVRYGGRSEIIPLIKGTAGFEYELIKRISLVLKPERPRIGILRTENYSQDVAKEYFKDLFAVMEADYAIDYVDLTQTYPIDQNIQTLIVPGGDADFWNNPYSLAAVDQYFMKGGKLIVLANRIAVNLAKSAVGVPQNSGLFEMLKRWGVDVSSEMIADFSCDVIQLQQTIDGKPQSYPMDYPFFMKITEEGMVNNNPALAGFQSLVFPWCSPTRIVANLPKTVKADTLLMSSKTAFVYGDPYTLNPRVYWDKRFAAAKSEGRVGQFPVAVHLTGEFKSLFASDSSTDQIVGSTTGGNLVVVGNSNFLTTGTVSAMFAKNLADWLTTNDKLISIKNRQLVDRSFKTSSLVNEKVRAMTYRIVNITLMPILLLVVGLFIYTKRRKAQKREGVL